MSKYDLTYSEMSTDKNRKHYNALKFKNEPHIEINIPERYNRFILLAIILLFTLLVAGGTASPNSQKLPIPNYNRLPKSVLIK